MARTLQEVRERKGISSVDKVFKKMARVAADPDRLPSLRTIARDEKRPIEDVDRILAATYLLAIDTDFDTEFEALAEIVNREAEILAPKFRQQEDPDGGAPTSNWGDDGSDLREDIAA